MENRKQGRAGANDCDYAGCKPGDDRETVNVRSSVQISRLIQQVPDVETVFGEGDCSWEDAHGSIPHRRFRQGRPLEGNDQGQEAHDQEDIGPTDRGGVPCAYSAAGRKRFEYWISSGQLLDSLLACHNRRFRHGIRVPSCPFHLNGDIGQSQNWDELDRTWALVRSTALDFFPMKHGVSNQGSSMNRVPASDSSSELSRLTFSNESTAPHQRAGIGYRWASSDPKWLLISHDNVGGSQ